VNLVDADIAEYVVLLVVRVSDTYQSASHQPASSTRRPNTKYKLRS
jgi:hypothetical protein